MRRLKNKRLSLLTILIFLVLFGSAAAGESWVITDKGGKVWNNHPQPYEKVTWSGGMDAGGYAAGQGTLQWFREGEIVDRYEGNPPANFSFTGNPSVEA